MSAIFGLIYHDGRPLPEPALEALTDKLLLMTFTSKRSFGQGLEGAAGGEPNGDIAISR